MVNLFQACTWLSWCICRAGGMPVPKPSITQFTDTHTHTHIYIYIYIYITGPRWVNHKILFLAISDTVSLYHLADRPADAIENMLCCLNCLLSYGSTSNYHTESTTTARNGSSARKRTFTGLNCLGLRSSLTTGIERLVLLPSRNTLCLF